MAEINITNAKRDRIASMFYGALLLVLGVLIAVLKRDALIWILIAGGVISVVFGTVDLLVVFKKANTVSVSSIVRIIIGAVLIILPGLVSDFLMVLLAILLCIYGVLNVLSAFAVSDAGIVRKIMGIAIGVLAVVAGIYALFNLDSTADAVMIVTGVLVALTGAIQASSGIAECIAYR